MNNEAAVLEILNKVCHVEDGFIQMLTCNDGPGEGGTIDEHLFSLNYLYKHGCFIFLPYCSYFFARYAPFPFSQNFRHEGVFGWMIITGLRSMNIAS